MFIKLTKKSKKRRVRVEMLCTFEEMTSLTSNSKRFNFITLWKLIKTLKFNIISIHHSREAYIYGVSFWPAQFVYCIYGFQNRNRAAQSDGFIGEYCGEYFLWRQHENDVTFSFGYYYTVTFSLYIISFVWRLP